MGECKRTSILKKAENGFLKKIVFDLFLTSLGRFAYFTSYAGFVGSEDKMVFELVCFSAKKLYFCRITFCITFLHNFLHNEHTCNLKILRNAHCTSPKKYSSIFVCMCTVKLV